MSQNASFIPLTLPGPATSPGAHIPSPTAPIQLQSVNSTGTSTNGSVDEQAKRDQAWKYEGYQAFSRWMASEDDFFVFRRFEALNAGVILWMQDRITQVEKRLEEIHQRVADAPPEHKQKNCSFRWDAQYLRDRHELMRELSGLLHHYNQYIDTFSRIRAKPRAEERQIANVRNWLARDAIDPDESAFLHQTGDLITINSRNRPLLGRWLEACPSLHLSRFFRAKHVRGLHVASSSTRYSDNQKFETTTNMCIILAGACLLLAPLWWLAYVSESGVKLNIITGFVCFFMTIMTLGTVNNPFGVVASTAAYAAVLIVFMQIEGKA
ncbi:hypothetical protein BDV95DRAFT_626391 [Massariosphaeria phaeospora]|uniref:DUF6594 domain-containing protein n=1 Tax=Massariosphaeria phaeospora TaxID=100035 RepID=A0A7C8M9R0_9PLEO|nr:hypothetical protein BDV95DRAFT_626391 [Massariosphaeria phaeospora]